MTGELVETPGVDRLDALLLESFAGRVVRKDLVQKMKVGFSIPVYVLEYLLGKFCSTVDEDEIAQGLHHVKQAITERVVRADQGELLKARLKRQGSFSRGDDKGTVSAEAGIVFNGNIDGDVESIARTSHLLAMLPETIRSDTAFHDRWHAYLPGWEMPKLKPEHLTSHLGFIADYLAEIFHNALRPLNFTDSYDRWFAFGNHVGQRDRKGTVRTVSGLVKLTGRPTAGGLVALGQREQAARPPIADENHRTAWL